MADEVIAKIDALTDEELWIAVYRDRATDLFWTLALRYQRDILVFGFKKAAGAAGPESPERIAADFFQWCLKDELARRWRWFDPERGYRLKTYTKMVIRTLWAEYCRHEMVLAAVATERGIDATLDELLDPAADEFTVTVDGFVDVQRRFAAAWGLINELRPRDAYLLESLWIHLGRRYGEKAAAYIRECLKKDPAREARAMLRLAINEGEQAVRDRLCRRMKLTRAALFTATHRAMKRWAGVCANHRLRSDN